MIKVCFTRSKDVILGFELSGHSGFSEEGTDIVCAAVSSASYMTANTLTEILGLNPEIKVDESKMTVKLSKNDAPKAQDILKGFLLHIEGLQEQYPLNITLYFTEV